jgi:hypothetical protein
MYQCSRKQFILAKNLYKWSKNDLHLNPAIASMKQKTPLLLHCSKKWVNAKKDCSDMDLAGDLAGDVGAIFYTIEAL